MRDGEVSLHHIFREANKCADVLANLGFELYMAKVEFDSPPSIVQQVMFDDFRGISFPRLVTV